MIRFNGANLTEIVVVFSCVVTNSEIIAICHFDLSWCESCVWICVEDMKRKQILLIQIQQQKYTQLLSGLWKCHVNVFIVKNVYFLFVASTYTHTSHHFNQSNIFGWCRCCYTNIYTLIWKSKMGGWFVQNCIRNGMNELLHINCCCCFPKKHKNLCNTIESQPIKFACMNMKVCANTCTYVCVNVCVSVLMYCFCNWIFCAPNFRTTKLKQIETEKRRKNEPNSKFQGNR